MRILSFLLFFSILCVIGFALHYYFWVRLIKGPELGDPWTNIGRWSLVFFGVIVPISAVLSRALPRHLSSPLSWLGYIWMGTAFYLFLSTAATDIIRFIGDLLMKLSSEPILDEGRRQLVARIGASAAGLTAGAAVIVATRNATDIQVEEVHVVVPKLPKALDGINIVQMSDVHIGPLLERGFCEKIVGIANGLKPDLVAITGDLVDGSVEQLRPHVEPLGNLKGRMGNYFITGNHEYYSGARSWINEVRRLGLRPLENEHVLVGDESAKLVLAGVTDYSAGRFSASSAPSVENALKGVNEEHAVVLLAHQPKEIENAAAHKVDLQISGHTHGGQIWPFNVLVHLAQPYVAGLYRHNDDTQIYVNRGTGYWGPPMRLGSPAEITKLVLTSS